MKLNKRDIKKWINALRSGRYTQTRGTLQDSGGYCCLGVACDLFIPKSNRIIDSFGYISGTLPSAQTYVPDWLKGISNDFCNKTGLALQDLNDIQRLTFEEISDLIESVYILNEGCE